MPIPACEDPARRARLEQDIFAWLRWYFADIFTYDFTLQQTEMVVAMQRALREGGDQALAASRGEGKTTLVECVLLFCVLAGLVKFAVLFSATGPDAKNSLDTIKQRLAENDRLHADYPEVCVPIRALENTPQRANYQRVTGLRPDSGVAYGPEQSRFSWCGRSVRLPRIPGSVCAGAIIATRGLDSAVRGLKINNQRPDVAIIDDPDTEQSVHSQDQAAKLERRIDRGIAGLGSQTRRIARVMLTTIQNRDCASYKYTDPQQKPSWHGRRFRFLVSPPGRKDLWDEYMHLAQTDWREGTAKAMALYLERRAEMDAGAVVANPNRHGPEQLSALQFYFDQVARLGQEAVSTEYDNDPPDDETTTRLVLSAYHIQTNCLSGLARRLVPEGTVCITAGADPQKLGLHYVLVAWNEQAGGCIIDYDFHEFLTEGRKAADCEVAILEGLFAWHAAQQENPCIGLDGELHVADLTLVDMGWKEESWNTQPVQVFCGQVGFSQCMPSKGFSPYRRPHDSKKLIVGENWHIAWPGRIPIAEFNADHYKLKVHEGFLADRGQPGSLTLFDPPRIDGRPNRTGHLSYAKHVLAETWESRFVPGFKGARTGWWKSPKPNHYFDATALAIVARSMRGISVLPAATHDRASPDPAAGPAEVISDQWSVVSQKSEPPPTSGGGRNRW